MIKRGLWKADPFDAPNVRPNLTYEIKILIPENYIYHLKEDVGGLMK